MLTHGELRIEPPEQILSTARKWLEPVRAALGAEFLSAYLTGSVLTRGFDPRRSRVNLLVVTATLDGATLDRLAAAIPQARTTPGVDPLFMTQSAIEKSLDSFPIEWVEIQERHLLLEGADLFAGLEVPRTYLRLQCEHELRGKHIQLRQAYLANHSRPAELRRLLGAAASGFATLFRTLLRLQGETPPADNAQVIERVSDVFGLDAHGLLAAHLVRHDGGSHSGDQVVALYRKYLTELDRLIVAIDRLRTA